MGQTDVGLSPQSQQMHRELGWMSRQVQSSVTGVMHQGKPAQRPSSLMYCQRS